MGYEFDISVSCLDDAADALSSILRTQDGYTPPTLQESFGYTHAYQIFCTTIAFLRHVPTSKFHYKGDLPHLWDRTSLSALARNLWDTYASYRFYSHDPKDEDEFKFRQDAGNFLAETRRLQMIRLQNPQSEYIPSLEAGVIKAQELLKVNPVFKNLSEPTQKQLIQRKEFQSIFVPHDILSEAGIETSFYQAGYKVLSNHSHFYSFALSQSLVFNINEKNGQIAYQAIVDYASLVVLFFLDDFKRWYPGSEYIWSQRVKDRLFHWRNAMNSRHST